MAGSPTVVSSTDLESAPDPEGSATAPVHCGCITSVTRQGTRKDSHPATRWLIGTQTWVLQGWGFGGHPAVTRLRLELPGEH